MSCALLICCLKIYDFALLADMFSSGASFKLFLTLLLKRVLSRHLNCLKSSGHCMPSAT